MKSGQRWHYKLAALALATALCIVPSLSFAEEGESKVGWDVGLKMWVATWQAPLLFLSSSGDALAMKSQTTALLGPTATIGFKTSDSDWFHHVWFNGTYLTSAGDFDFDFNKTAYGYRSVKADRQDVNLIAGVNVYGGLSAYAGYFGSFQDVKYTTTTSTTVNREINAFVVGLAGHEALSDHVDLKGNAGVAVGSYQYRAQNSSGGSTTAAPKDLYGWSTEVGLNIHANMKKFDPYFYLGMRVQEYEVPQKLTNGQTLRYTDITYGPMFQIGAKF